MAVSNLWRNFKGIAINKLLKFGKNATMDVNGTAISNYDLTQINQVNAAFTSGALTATGAETVYDTTVTIDYSVDGKLYSKTAVTDGTTPTANPDSVTFTGLATEEGCIFVWCLNAAGTVGVWQGPVAGWDTTGSAFDNADEPKFPTIPAAWTPFAYQVLVHDSSGSGEWNFGTDNWNATGVEDIIVNVHKLPRNVPTDAPA